MELATDIILHSSCLCWCISLKSVNCFCCSVTKSCLTLCDPMAACQAPLSSTIAWSWLRFKSVESVMLSNHLIPGRPFSFCLQSFPVSGSFLVSQLFASGGQSIGASASASVLPRNQFSSVQLLSCVRLFATPWIAARWPPCPSPTPGVHSDSGASSQWCHPAISKE